MTAGTINRWSTSVAIVAGLGLALTACSSNSPASTPSPAPTSSETAAGVADPLDDLWNFYVASQFPDAKRPNVNLVRYVAPNELSGVKADCLHEGGYPDASVTADGGLSYGVVPEGQEEALAIALYVCSVQFQSDPKFSGPLSAEQLDTLYDYYTGELAQCIEAQGFTVADAPSRATFIDSYQSTGWSPYQSLTQISQQQWDDLNEACPQWPSGFYGF